MARIKQLKKTQKEVNKIIRGLNKELKEDCFAGRFEYRQIGRKYFNDDDWYSSIYKIEFRDNEDPSRNKVGYYNKYDILYGWDFFNMMNDLIIESDFWDKWRDFDYAKDHWYSGKQLTEMVKMCGDKWRSAEALRDEEPDRFKLQFTYTVIDDIIIMLKIKVGKLNGTDNKI